jgi:hypothetical protein
MHENGQAERLEQVLRAAGPAPLAPGFKRGVLDAIGRLPDPALIPAAPRLPLKLYAALAAVVVVLGALALILPETSTTLAAWQWDLSQTSVALSIGETALSASLLSVVCTLVATAVLTAVGMYGKRNHLIGA